jgi:hypothetical protein
MQEGEEIGVGVLMGLLKTDKWKLEIGTYGRSPPGKNN